VRKFNRKRVENRTFEKKPEKAEPEGRLEKNWVTDAVILAALSISSYVFHYLFEFGYLSYFGVPAAFISFEFATIIPALLFLAAAYLLFIFVVWPFFHALIQVIPRPLRSVISFAPWLVFLALFGFSSSSMLLMALVILLLFGMNRVNAIRPLQKMGGAGNPSPKVISTAYRDRILPHGSGWQFLYIFITALLSSVAFGRIAAVTRTTYPVIESPSSCAVIYMAADRYICTPFNENEFERAFKVLYFQENQTIEFRNENIGPLYPEANP